ncbi:MAG: hypothetical protein CMI13_11135 [Oleibacter sp.]|nr:hypothetical protein [Thalassolituus sp.]|tara:strand:- start:1110 stop:1529 length:420 start_codon:yes stop_codon:yes gene_type:complete
MKKERSKFTPEFKLEAVSLVLNKNYTVMQACAALEIGPTALRRWIKQYKQEQQGIIPEGCIALSPEQRQIQELQKRIERLELEKDILKKATVDSTGQCNIMHTGNYRGFQNAAASIKDQRADPSAEAGAMGSMEERPVA